MTEHASMAAFKNWLLKEEGRRPDYERAEALEGAEAGAADLIVRLHVLRKSYYEVRLKLAENALEVGFSTESRMVNEEIEQAILDDGGNLDDLLADELCDLGGEPLPMRHFFDRPAFRFTTVLPCSDPTQLDDPSLRKQVTIILKACHRLFQGCVDEA